MFVDEVTVAVESGGGGNGCVAWRRESHVPRGGPAGGNGGRGGDIVVVADPGIHTLLDLRYRKHFRAKRGVHGGGQDKTGRRGQDCEIRVPVGTLLYDAETGELLVDLAGPGQRFVAAEGGHGGRGNAHFASPTHRAPDQSTEGGPPVGQSLRMELKLLADVGLVGFPNAGKSTLIARVSRARPRIADYPFTTLVPNLGVAEIGDMPPFVIADIPGLIEGAHAGVGLGHRFLRHVERTALLAYVIDQDAEAGRDPVDSFRTLRRELALYDAALAERAFVVVLNKVDLPDVQAHEEAAREVAAAHGAPFFAISAATGQGVDALLRELARSVAGSKSPH